MEISINDRYLKTGMKDLANYYFKKAKEVPNCQNCPKTIPTIDKLIKSIRSTLFTDDLENRNKVNEEYEISHEMFLLELLP